MTPSIHFFDLTIAFEGVELPQIASVLYTLRGMYLEHMPPPRVSFHIRAYDAKQVPRDIETFSGWMHDRWMEKDRLLDNFYTTGHFGSAPDRSGDDSSTGEKSAPSPKRSMFSALKPKKKDQNVVHTISGPLKLASYWQFLDILTFHIPLLPHAIFVFKSLCSKKTPSKEL